MFHGALVELRVLPGARTDVAGWNAHEYDERVKRQVSASHGPPCFPSEFNWNCGSYRQSTGLHKRGISHIAKLLSTQDNTDAEWTHTDIHASNVIRTNDPSVLQAFRTVACSREATVADTFCSLQTSCGAMEHSLLGAVRLSVVKPGKHIHRRNLWERVTCIV
jgi:hypothetical protein